MEKIVTPALMVCAFAIIFVMLRHSGNKSRSGDKYDERQVLVRGRAYRLAFFSTLVYMAVYACIDVGGVSWCEPSVGMEVGIFVGVTVFAVAAIARDAFNGIRSSKKSLITVWALVIMTQIIAFLGGLAEESLLSDGKLNMPVVHLFCAICFVIILIVYLVHEKKAELPEEG